MTSKEVASLVETQLGGEWDRTNLHGIDLRTCLTTPQKPTFFWAGDEEPIDAWLVLREDPQGGDGYAVVFDEGSEQFGLAQFAKGYEPCLLARIMHRFSSRSGESAGLSARPASVL